MSVELDALRNLWTTTAEPEEQTRAAARARLFKQIAADANRLPSPRTAPEHSRSQRRLLLAVAACVIIVAASAAGIAAALGAFSGTTVAQLEACVPSTTALTTASGAQVLTGHTEDGVYCVAYHDPNGASGGTAGRLGATPVGDALAVKALDTASHTYVIAGVVPAGYTTLKVGSTEIPIANRAFVVDAEKAVGPAVLSGPAGTISINLREFAAP